MTLNKLCSFSHLSYLYSLGHLSSSSLHWFQSTVSFLDHDQTRPNHDWIDLGTWFHIKLQKLYFLKYFFLLKMSLLSHTHKEKQTKVNLSSLENNWEVLSVQGPLFLETLSCKRFPQLKQIILKSWEHSNFTRKTAFIWYQSQSWWHVIKISSFHQIGFKHKLLCWILTLSLWSDIYCHIRNHFPLLVQKVIHSLFCNLEHFCLFHFEPLDTDTPCPFYCYPSSAATT